METVVTEPTPLLDILKKLSPDSSINTLKSWIEQGRVVVDERVSLGYRTMIDRGQAVSVRPRSQISEEGVKILYEDKAIVVIEKPTKLLTVATDFEFEKTVHTILKRRSSANVYPVHRLDKDTSGVMLFAYTAEARDKLKKKFMEHDIEREYCALIDGRLRPSVGTWESELAEDEETYVVRSAKGGKRAVTHYEVMSHNRKISLVRFRLETGRKNQIRVHCSEAGHPILGDVKYGGRTSRFGRLCLHAHVLGFTHPISQKKLSFTSPLPAFFHT